MKVPVQQGKKEGQCYRSLKAGVCEILSWNFIHIARQQGFNGPIPA